MRIGLPPRDPKLAELARLYTSPKLRFIRESDPAMRAANATQTGKSTSSAETSIPAGCILMWSGAIADIPAGWVLCDGNNGTPDLRDRFVVGAREDDSGVAKTNITGSLTTDGGSTSYTPTGSISVAIADHASHTHTVVQSTFTTLTLTPALGATQVLTGGGVVTSPSGGPSATLTHSISSQTFTGDAGSIVSPYYALAFIMKT